MSYEQKYIYVMFSSTPFKMGKFIRKITNYEFNHVSVCLHTKEMTMYSFARIFKGHPFYGGFVKESSARFIHNETCAHVKLCAIPVSDTQYNRLKKYVEQMEDDSDKYVYNHLSVIGAVFKKKVKVKDAYTCVEFTTKLLNKSEALPQMDKNKFYGIRELEETLAQYVVYQGPFENMRLEVNNHGDTFYKNKNYYTGMYLAFCTNARLFYSFFRSY